MKLPSCGSEKIKVFLVLFLQKKNTSSFSEEKEAKRLLFLGQLKQMCAACA
jgi:hypothetical protein